MSYHPFKFRFGDEVLYMNSRKGTIATVANDSSSNRDYPVTINRNGLASFTRDGRLTVKDLLPSLVVIEEKDKKRIKSLDLESPQGAAKGWAYIMKMVIKYKWEKRK